MADSQPDPVHDPYEGMTPGEKDFTRKKEIASDLRALVRHPGWQYLVTVLHATAYDVRMRQMSAGSMDALLAMNLDIREAETYISVVAMPENIINEFTIATEVRDDD